MFGDRLEVRPAVLWAANPAYTRESNFNPQLKQLRILSLGLLQDGDVWVGVFPQREEIFVRAECPDAGRVGVRALQGSCLHYVGAGETYMRERPREAISNDSPVLQYLLKLGGTLLALS